MNVLITIIIVWEKQINATPESSKSIFMYVLEHQTFSNWFSYSFLISFLVLFPFPSRNSVGIDLNTNFVWFTNVYLMKGLFKDFFLLNWFVVYKQTLLFVIFGELRAESQWIFLFGKWFFKKNSQKIFL